MLKIFTIYIEPLIKANSITYRAEIFNYFNNILLEFGLLECFYNCHSDKIERYLAIVINKLVNILLNNLSKKINNLEEQKKFDNLRTSKSNKKKPKKIIIECDNRRTLLNKYSIPILYQKWGYD